MGPRTRRGLLALTALTGACLVEPQDDGGESTVVEALPVTCSPRLERYPIAGPHNGGYDRAWSNFTCPAHPAGSPDNSDYGGAHHGNDLFAARGTPVVAVRAGRVTRSGVASSISGNRVTIEDSCGWSYYYGHLNSIADGITVGARVTAGQRIGTVGNTGATGTAPHVHFNVHRDGNYNNDVDPFPLLRAADSTACNSDGGNDERCDPRCSGSVAINARCDRSDCSRSGSRCVDDDLGARCVFPACPARGNADACWRGRYVVRCRNGRLLSRGDCGAYGASCVDDSRGARCVFHACRPTGEHATCWGGRYLGRCRDGRLVSQGDCGAFGAGCVQDNLGARCVFFACRPQGEHDTCWQGRFVGHCRDGALTSQGDCARDGSRCVQDALGARCVSPMCGAARGEGSFCIAGDRLVRCRDGVPTDHVNCAASGERCVMDGASSARCAPPGTPPPPFDAGPPPLPEDAGGPEPDVGFPLPDAWEPLPEDASLPPADVLVGADVPPAPDAEKFGEEDVEEYFAPDAGTKPNPEEGAEPRTEDDGEDPCSVCRPLNRCPPGLCDGSGMADPTESAPACSCRAGVTGSRGGRWAWALAALAAVRAGLRARRRRPR